MDHYDAPTDGSEKSIYSKYLNYLISGLDLNEKFHESKIFYGNLITDSESLTSYCQKDPNFYVKCNLRIISPSKGICIPYERHDSIQEIEINGQSNLQHTFNKDIVLVKVIDNNSSRMEGKVIGVYGRTLYQDVEHPVFVCTQDASQPHLMLPLCKTVPKINIREPENGRARSVSLFEFDSRTGGLKFKSNVNSFRDGIKVVFIVTILKWNKNNMYPLGAVIGIQSYDRTDLRVHSEVLEISLGIMPKGTSRRRFPRIESNEGDGENGEDFGPCLTVFTIDSDHSTVLDDAFSVKEFDDGNFEIGVHIADVASFVRKGDDYDEDAREKCETSYKRKGHPPNHMFPDEFREIVSLNESKKRRTLSVFFMFDANGRRRENNARIVKSIVKSLKQLTYHEAQQILDDKVLIPPIDTSICKAVKHLGHIADQVRKRRLGKSSFAVLRERTANCNDCFDKDARKAKQLVEEFMILTNSEVAKFTIRSHKPLVPLRRHMPPETEKMHLWLEEYKSVAHVICQLQDVTVNLQGINHLGIENTQPQGEDSPIRLKKSVWNKLMKAVEKGCMTEIQELLCDDDLHPKQNKAVREWKEIHKKAEYVCSANVENIPIEGQHFNLRLAPYVHFTSPIRRYIDVVSQRLVHAAISGFDAPYQIQDIKDLCVDVNDKSRKLNDYHKQIYKLEFVNELLVQPIRVIATVEEVTDYYFTLTLPELNDQMQLNRIDFKYLNISFQKQLAFEHTLLAWKKRLFKSGGQGLLCRRDNRHCQKVHPNINSTFVSYSDWEEVLRTFMENKNKECMMKIRSIGEQTESKSKQTVPDISEHKLVEDITSEVTDRKDFVVNQYCQLEMEFEVHQALSVELTAVETDDQSNPFVQLLHITDTVSFCLLHTTYPVRTLAQFATRRTKKQYRDEREYCYIWLPILGMEFATNAVQSQHSATINDLAVTITDRSKGRGRITLPKSYCEERDIDFGALDFNNSNRTHHVGNFNFEGEEPGIEKDILSPNYLCIRLPASNKSLDKNGDRNKFTWVAHGETTKMTLANNKYLVDFKFHRRCIPFPETVTEELNVTSTMEILSKTVVDRRIEVALKTLEIATPLAKAVALGHYIHATGDLHRSIINELLLQRQYITLTNDLNTNQKKAAENALGFRFSLIQGPPGTGKTRTAITLIKLFDMFNTMHYERTKKKYVVVYCGPSNKSVDHSAKWMKLTQKQGQNKLRIVRMYGKSFECIDFPVPGQTEMQHKGQNNRTDPFLKENGMVLHHIIRQKGKPYAQKINTFDRRFNTNPHNVLFNDVKEYLDILNKATQEELQNYDVIFCTTSLTANPKLRKSVDVYQCIIDECGMCTEPETMVPIVATRAEQIVLIGDHKQLQPIVLNKEAGNLGLRTSLFERYIENHAVKKTKLIEQYRMHPSICKFPSDEFYEGTLVNSTAWQEYAPLRIWRTLQHLAFVDVRGEEITLNVASEEGNEKSKKNQEEAKQVVKLCKHLVEVEGVQETNIMVMSQYNAQRFHLYVKLNPEFPDIKINTVIASQGMECDYVIFSSVRSLPSKDIVAHPSRGWRLRNLGFITDEHQINVAITRAKKGLFLIGNKELLQCDAVWANLIGHFENNNCVFTPSTFFKY